MNGSIGNFAGVPVLVDATMKPWDWRYRATPNTVPTLYVGSMYWLNYRLWLDEQRAASRRNIDALLARAWVETFPYDETLRMKW